MDHDDFEFKPINEGLGFHKKVIDLKNETMDIKTDSKASTQSQNNSQRKTQSSITQDLFKRDKDIFQSIKDPSIKFYNDEDRALFDNSQKMNEIKERISARKSELDQNIRARESISNNPMATSTFGDTKKLTHKIPNLETDLALELANQKTQSMEKATAPKIGPALLDLFVVVGLTAIFAVPLLMITEVDPIRILLNAQKDLATQLSLAVLVISVLNFYLIVSRSFFSSTLGEWAFDLKVGTIKQRNSILYPFKILFRSLLMTITGIVLLPLIGLIIRKDILGAMSGTKLVSEH